MYLNVKNVTMDDWLVNTSKCLHLTSESLTWDLNTALYKEQEAAMTDDYVGLVPVVSPQTLIINLLSSLTTPA